MVAIREATPEDLPAITTLYNHYVESTPITFDIRPFSPEERRPWLEQFATTGRHRLLVAEREGELLGYAGSHGFRAKAAYDPSIETTIYLADGAGGRGVGRQLYSALFESIADEDVHCAYAGITLPNEASMALHQRLGFESIGVFHEVGRKFDRYWDVEWFEKRL